MLAQSRSCLGRGRDLHLGRHHGRGRGCGLDLGSDDHPGVSLLGVWRVNVGSTFHRTPGRDPEKNPRDPTKDRNVSVTFKLNLNSGRGRGRFGHGLDLGRGYGRGRGAGRTGNGHRRLSSDSVFGVEDHRGGPDSDLARRDTLRLRRVGVLSSRRKEGRGRRVRTVGDETSSAGPGSGPPRWQASGRWRRSANRRSGATGRDAPLAPGSCVASVPRSVRTGAIRADGPGSGRSRE